jgi:hypothetical protein
MDMRDLLDIGCTGAMLAVVLRWLLRLDVELHWAVCIGAAGLLLEPWLSLHFGPHLAGRSVENLTTATIVALAIFGGARMLRVRRAATSGLRS